MMWCEAINDSFIAFSIVQIEQINKIPVIIDIHFFIDEALVGYATTAAYANVNSYLIVNQV